MDNGQLRYRLCRLIKIVASGDTKIVNCQLSIVHSIIKEGQYET